MDALKGEAGAGIGGRTSATAARGPNATGGLDATNKASNCGWAVEGDGAGGCKLPIPTESAWRSAATELTGESSSVVVHGSTSVCARPGANGAGIQISSFGAGAPWETWNSFYLKVQTLVTKIAGGFTPLMYECWG